MSNVTQHKDTPPSAPSFRPTFDPTDEAIAKAIDLFGGYDQDPDYKRGRERLNDALAAHGVDMSKPNDVEDIVSEILNVEMRKGFLIGLRVGSMAPVSYEAPPLPDASASGRPAPTETRAQTLYSANAKPTSLADLARSVGLDFSDEADLVDVMGGEEDRVRYDTPLSLDAADRYRDRFERLIQRAEFAEVPGVIDELLDLDRAVGERLSEMQKVAFLRGVEYEQVDYEQGNGELLARRLDRTVSALDAIGVLAASAADPVAAVAVPDDDAGALSQHADAAINDLGDVLETLVRSFAAVPTKTDMVFAAEAVAGARRTLLDLARRCSR